MRFIFFASYFFALISFADEPVADSAHWHELGYQEFESALQSAPPENPPPLKGPLEWPVDFEDASHSLGNVMLQFQEYTLGQSYFHGGCDLRSDAAALVRSPVAGHVEASHYAFAPQRDGSLKKFVKPWPLQGPNLYFEISVTTATGYRFEFHHVDRATLPAELAQGLDRGDAQVKAGGELGRVIEWPSAGSDGSLYHHLHYNIFDPHGRHLNPEAFAALIPDTQAPVIHGVFAVLPNGETVKLEAGAQVDRPVSEFVVATTDRNDENVYTHTPPFLRLSYEGGAETLWDFRQSLESSDGRFPDIWSLFKRSITSDDGTSLNTRGNYTENFFLIRLAVPENGHGPFEIRVQDQAGNFSTFAGSNR